MDFCKNGKSASELAAMVNGFASLLAKGKSVDEVEMMAVLFDMLSDTLFAIAVIERKQEKLREKFCPKNPKDND